MNTCGEHIHYFGSFFCKFFLAFLGLCYSWVSVSADDTYSGQTIFTPAPFKNFWKQLPCYQTYSYYCLPLFNKLATNITPIIGTFKNEGRIIRCNSILYSKCN